MNAITRIKMVKAMEFLASRINDENVLEGWLINGVADGDIDYGDLGINQDDEQNMEYYTSDENFADLMGTFLMAMSRARKSGGLYCDGIVSTEG